MDVQGTFGSQEEHRTVLYHLNPKRCRTLCPWQHPSAPVKQRCHCVFHVTPRTRLRSRIGPRSVPPLNILTAWYQRCSLLMGVEKAVEDAQVAKVSFPNLS